MSYHEKRAVVSAVTSVLITILYSLFVYQRFLAGNQDLLNNSRFWGSVFLIFILISIVANIVIAIGFNIAYAVKDRESIPSISDERDKLIELLGSRNALIVFSIGVVHSVTTLVFNQPIYVLLISLTFAGLVSSVVADITQLHLYRRGF